METVLGWLLLGSIVAYACTRNKLDKLEEVDRTFNPGREADITLRWRFIDSVVLLLLFIVGLATAAYLLL